MGFWKEAIENLASRHLDYIKSGGEKGASAMETLEVFEKSVQNDPNVLETLRAEYSVIEALASDMEALLLNMRADNLVRQHLTFIKSYGREGRSAMADMADFEIEVQDKSYSYSLLKTEYFILKTLTKAMQEELRRMEEKENA